MTALMAALMVLGQVPPPAAVQPAAAAAPTATAAPLAAPRCVVLPVETVAGATADVVDAAAGLEGALGAALARQGGLRIMTRTDIMGLLGEAQQQQLMGCDAQGCLAEVADALGADMILRSTLERQGGLWNFQAVMLDRKSASALRRVALRARGLQQLVASLDELARQLSTGTHVSLEDPTLQSRLGTNAAGVAVLRKELAGKADGDLIGTWTRVIIEHNRESGVLALAQGGVLLAGGLVLAMGGVLFAGTAALHTMATYSRWGTEEQAVRSYPWFTAVLWLMVPVPLVMVALAASGAVATLAVLDLLDRGKVTVSKRGCCRDEHHIQAANKPDWMRQVAPYLAAVGACAALLFPLLNTALVLVYFPISLFGVRFPTGWFGPAVDLDRTTYGDVDSAVNNIAFVSVILLTVPYALVALAGTAALISTTRNNVLDAE